MSDAEDGYGSDGGGGGEDGGGAPPIDENGYPAGGGGAFGQRKVTAQMNPMQLKMAEQKKKAEVRAWEGGARRGTGRRGGGDGTGEGEWMWEEEG